MHEMVDGASPGPQWGAYSAPPDPSWWGVGGGLRTSPVPLQNYCMVPTHMELSIEPPLLIVGL